MDSEMSASDFFCAVRTSRNGEQYENLAYRLSLIIPSKNCLQCLEVVGLKATYACCMHYLV